MKIFMTSIMTIMASATVGCGDMVNPFSSVDTCVYYDVYGNRVDNPNQSYLDPEDDAQRIFEQDVSVGRIRFIHSTSRLGRGVSTFFEDEPMELPVRPTDLGEKFGKVIENLGSTVVDSIVITEGLKKYSSRDLVFNRNIDDDMACYANEHVMRYVHMFNRKMLDLHAQALEIAAPSDVTP